MNKDFVGRESLGSECAYYRCVRRLGERDEAGVRLEWGVAVSERADQERRLGAGRRAVV